MHDESANRMVNSSADWLVQQEHHQMADMNNASHANLHFDHFLFHFNSILGSSSLPVFMTVVKTYLFGTAPPLKCFQKTS